MASYVEHKGNPYIVLRNSKGILAVYRVIHNGALRRLRRWPKAINRD